MGTILLVWDWMSLYCWVAQWRYWDLKLTFRLIHTYIYYSLKSIRHVSDNNIAERSEITKEKKNKQVLIHWFLPVDSHQIIGDQIQNRNQIELQHPYTSNRFSNIVFYDVLFIWKYRHIFNLFVCIYVNKFCTHNSSRLFVQTKVKASCMCV